MARLLLAEGNATLREWSRQHLTAGGYLVTAGSHGRQLLDSARSERPDLYILATDLPDNSAFAFAAALRSDARTALSPILFMVPADDREGYAHAVTIEPDGVITKPFTSSVLRDAVHRRLGTCSDTAIDSAGGRGGMGRSHPLASAGMLVESRQASVLFVSLRNLVTLARSLRARTLETMLHRFVTDAGDAITREGGWIVRADATGLLALFEDGPNADRTHASRALEAAMAAILATRRTKQWAQATLSDVFVPQISIGCGIDSGEVIVARLSLGGDLAPSVAGRAVDIANRLDGRSKGLGWSIAVSEATALLAGTRFQFGRRATLTDADHGTVTIVEMTSFNHGAARPGELPMMAEVRDSIVSNAVLAGLAGDAQPDEADRTIVVGRAQPAASEPEVRVPHRRILRHVSHGACVTACRGVNENTGREEFLKIVTIAEVADGFVERYLDDHRRIADLDQRNVMSIYEIGRDDRTAFVSCEFLPGGSLQDALRKRLPIGLSLNYLAQMSMALDALHGIDLFHGSLCAEHFLFRKERVVVLADFNATDRALAAVRRDQGVAQTETPLDATAGRRADFRALGLILGAMLLGRAPGHGADHADHSRITSAALPIELSPLRPCLDGLLGKGEGRPFERAEELLVELMTLREVFPFDLRATDAESASQS